MQLDKIGIGESCYDQAKGEKPNNKINGMAQSNSGVAK
jgi:hypothetical protein